MTIFLAWVGGGVLTALAALLVAAIIYAVRTAAPAEPDFMERYRRGDYEGS